MDPEKLLLDHLPHLEKVIAHVCRRSRFRKEEAEDFASTVKVRLIENDYAILRKFQGKSSLKTYLTVVVNNLMLDYQNHRWGKIRPSAEAGRLGDVAVRLERLITREELTFDQACEVLRTNEKVELSWQELLRLAVRLPTRYARRVEGEERLAEIPAPDGRADARIVDHERQALRRKAFEALRTAREALSPDDQFLLKLSLDLKVSDIARTRRLDQKALYRQLDRIKKTLREALEKAGIRRQDIGEIFGEGGN
jgi:RNA polymerase sigma factor (sigma-70 family)